MLETLYQRKHRGRATKFVLTSLIEVEDKADNVIGVDKRDRKVRYYERADE